MARHRFSVDATAIDLAQQQVWLQDEELHHLSRVLRLRVGAEVNVFDSEGREFLAVIDAITAKQAQLTITEQLSNLVESPLALTLVQGISKGERFDLVVQKATELGVWAIQPLVSQYTEVPEARNEKRLQRWQRIALEATKQAGRRRVPTIYPPISWSQLLVDNRCATRPIFFAEQGGSDWATLTAQLTPLPTPALVAVVGAEGGWSRTEFAQAIAAQWNCLTLGPRILRTETAGITAVALLQHYFGDLR